MGERQGENKATGGGRLAKAEELLANLYELHDFFFSADKTKKKVRAICSSSS